MKIGYWLGTADLYGGGVGSYAWRILDHILMNSHKSKIDIYVICSSGNRLICLDLAKKYNAKIQVETIPSLNYFQKFLDRSCNFIQENFSNKNDKIVLFSKYINPWFYWYRSLNIDILHIPYQLSSIYSVVAQGNLNYPFIVTMHDLQEIHYPEFFSPFERAYRANFFWKALENSHGVITSFQHVKNDVLKYFNIPESKVHICPIPFQSISLKSFSDAEAKAYENKYLQYKENFLLYPAQTWEHKNHLSLIQSLEILKKEYDFEVNLICTGRKNPNFFPKIRSFIESSTLAHQIIFTDIVDEQELHWLYKKCSLVVIPTLYEAGSFPLMEAMSLQAPVICSSVTSLPETICDKRFIFNPLNPQEIATLIYKILNDNELRQANMLNSQLRVEKLLAVNTFSYLQECWYKTLKSQDVKVQ